MAEGFVSRWARRKEQVRRGESPVEPQVDRPAPPAPALSPAPQPMATEAVAERPPAPTLADVGLLTRESDYARFVAPGVGDEVKRAAMKKLFTDPHFNVMDGLDTYIEDYGRPDPLPAAWLRQMVQSKALGLFDDDDDADRQAAIGAAPDPAALAGPGRAPMPPDGAPAVDTAPSTPVVPLAAAEPASDDEDPDLRLQPHDAARRRRIDEGPGGQSGGLG